MPNFALKNLFRSLKDSSMLKMNMRMHHGDSFVDVS